MSTSSDTNELPKVSIVIPCRNEAKRIQGCLESVDANDFPKDRLEVLVMDGMSDDGTQAIVESFAADHPYVRLIENPRRIAPAALNIGIAASEGQVIIRLDAHNEYPPDYISLLVYWLDKSGADNVGGRWITRPSADTAIARAIALGVSHPFGVGNAHYRLKVSEPRWVDTVPFGCYRREVFDRIGTFDEELVRNQDLEFNLRLRRAGGKILLVPQVASYYHARDSLQKLWRMYYQYGYFNPLVSRKLGGRMTFRQAIPPLFVLALLVSGALALWFSWMLVVFAAILTAYAVPVAVCSIRAMPKHGVRCGLALALVFATLHVSNGLGSLKGILDFFILRKRVTTAHADKIPITR